MAASCKPLNDYFKVVVILERRSDGGLRAYSDDVPGFVLSHADPKSVLADIKPSLEGVLSHIFEGKVIVEELGLLREKITHHESAPPTAPTDIYPMREYVTHLADAQMIAVRFLNRAEWEAKLRTYECEPLKGKGSLNTAEWWQTPWKHPFTVPIESDGRCDEWAIARVILDIVKCAPADWKFPD